jgi:hypothetical protein
MRFEVAKNSADANNQNNQVNSPPLVPVSFGTDSSGHPWTILVSVITYGSARQINWTLEGDGDMMTPNESAQISTYVTNKRTYVLADLPRAIAATADLHVSRAGLDPVIVPFNDIDPTLDRTFAAYAFSELGPFTAQIVAPDGTVLAGWPSS